ALSCFEQTLRIRPEHVKALVWKARVLDELGMKQQAYQTLSKARKLDPDISTRLSSKYVHD
ncbi:MAG: tetratricopeptide repeat protein, partial [Methanomicrobiales archaeon]|nr:tetratricopeptide repeat protein [Methanomicrobiales archaeon]